MSDTIDPFALPQRQSTRAKHHNYHWTASYFITIRAEHHEPVFEMPELHAILQEQWDALPTRFPCIQLDTFIIMPDHVHGLLHFKASTADTDLPSLGDIVGAYKSLTSVGWFRYIKMHNIYWKGKLWQRNFHDHAIHDDADLDQKRQYILNNPIRWAASNPYK